MTKIKNKIKDVLKEATFVKVAIAFTLSISVIASLVYFDIDISSLSVTDIFDFVSTVNDSFNNNAAIKLDFNINTGDTYIYN